MLTLLTTSTPATTSDHGQGLQNILDQITASGASAALAEFRDGQTVWRASSGHTRLGHSGPAPVNGRFRIASVTKTFIATVVLQLVAEGRASLDDTLEHHLPGLVPGGDRITLRNLLRHTSGIADYTNYILLGLMIEHRTSQPLETVVSQRILRPLGLRDTELPGTSPFIHGPHAHGYLPIEHDGQIHPLDINRRTRTGSAIRPAWRQVDRPPRTLTGVSPNRPRFMDRALAAARGWLKAGLLRRRRALP